MIQVGEELYAVVVGTTSERFKTHVITAYHGKETDKLYGISITSDPTEKGREIWFSD